MAFLLISHTECIESSSLGDLGSIRCPFPCRPQDKYRDDKHCGKKETKPVNEIQ